MRRPEEAVAALVAALEQDDTAALAKVLGPGSEELVVSGDAVADRAERANFVASYKAKNSLVPEGASMTARRRRQRLADAGAARAA